MNTDTRNPREASRSTAGTIFSALWHVVLLMTLGLAFAGPVLAQRKAGATPPAAPPPLLDRELFFGDPEIVGAQLSPDGQYIAFLKPYKGSRNIWVKKTTESFDSAKLITADMKRPISQYFWSRDGKYILFVQD